MNLAADFLFSVVPSYLRGKQTVTQVCPCSSSWGVAPASSGTCQCWPRRGCRGHSLLGHPCDRAGLQEHPRSPELSQQLLSELWEARAPICHTKHGQESCETHLHTLLPAQAAWLLWLHKELFCLPELPFQGQPQLPSTPAPGTNREPGRGRDESNRTLPFGCC